MKNSIQCAKQFKALLKKLGTPTPPELPDAQDPVAVLVLSFLMWESSTEKALTAYRHIRSNVVDFNDLRVCMPQETVDFIGVRYPRALDRAQRLRATLRDIYSREHAVNLRPVTEMGKRDARKYVESLEGMVPYVAARTLLLGFDAHAVPIDDQLRTQLIAAEAADASCEVPELASWLERQVKASDGAVVHYALQAWIDAGGSPAGAAGMRRSGTKRKTTRKTARKTTRKTASKTASKTARKTVRKKKTVAKIPVVQDIHDLPRRDNTAEKRARQ